MMKYAFLIFAACSLGSCAYRQARVDYDTSATQYKVCLVSNPATPQNCEGLRLAMEADERKFNNYGAALNGNQGTRNVTVLNR